MADKRTICFQYAYKIYLDMPEVIGREHLLQNMHQVLYTVADDNPEIKNIAMHPIIENVGSEKINGMVLSYYMVYILFDVPIEMIRDKTADQIQEMLIPHAHKILQINPYGFYRSMEYRVIKCELDNIVICDDILDDVTDETRWIWNISNDIARNPCCEWAKEEDKVIYDENMLEIKEPCMD